MLLQVAEAVARDKIARNTGFWNMSRDASTSSRKRTVSVLTEDRPDASIPFSRLMHTRIVRMKGLKTDPTKETLMSKWKDISGTTNDETSSHRKYFDNTHKVR